MTRRVLLIEPDVDVLGELASKLRSRGLEVWLADGLESALARARLALPEVLLTSASLAAEASFVQRLSSVPGLSQVPRLRWTEGEESNAGAGELLRHNGEAIAQRVYALPPRGAVAGNDTRDFRGDLGQLSVADLLQLLSMNRRSGALTLQTALGAGEVRLVEGEIVDALYRRLEGQKALFRLLAEGEGTFSFTGGGSSALFRRINAPTASLLMEGMRQQDEVRRAREALDLGDDGLVALAAPSSKDSETARLLLEMLLSARTLPELLDETPALDAEVLSALSELLHAGKVRRIAGGTRRVDLADPDRLGVLAALAKRVARPGFRGATRVAIAGTPQRLQSIAAALTRVSEAMPPAEPTPMLPVPHVLSSLRLGEGVDLEIVGLPLIEAYAPLWNLVLPSCAALAALEPECSTLLENACQTAGVPRLDAATALADSPDDDAADVAQLIQRLLESAAGG